MDECGVSGDWKQTSRRLFHINLMVSPFISSHVEIFSLSLVSLYNTKEDVQAKHVFPYTMNVNHIVLSFFLFSLFFTYITKGQVFDFHQ